MTCLTPRRQVACGLSIALLITISGCTSRSSAKEEPAVLDVATARHALDLALKAWKNGTPPGPVPGSNPPIHVIDSHRNLDRPLVGYEILGEVTADFRRCFAVRLTLEGDEEPEAVRFVVFGQSPRFVYRMEDFTMMMRWEHDMEAEESLKTPPATPAGKHEP